MKAHLKALGVIGVFALVTVCVLAWPRVFLPTLFVVVAGVLYTLLVDMLRDA